MSVSPRSRPVSGWPSGLASQAVAALAGFREGHLRSNAPRQLVDHSEQTRLARAFDTLGRDDLARCPLPAAATLIRIVSPALT